jgi:hypothetical protein
VLWNLPSNREKREAKWPWYRSASDFISAGEMKAGGGLFDLAQPVEQLCGLFVGGRVKCDPH